MGMAASQARLLTITARMHDVEYQAQSIQNAKIQLATQSDQVYQNYLEALDATTLTTKDHNGNMIVANFNNLFGIDAVDMSNDYALFDNKGRLVVSSEVADGYNKYKGKGNDDAYTFAMWMVSGGTVEDINNLDLTDVEKKVAQGTDNYSNQQAALEKIAKEAIDVTGWNSSDDTQLNYTYDRDGLNNALEHAKDNNDKTTQKALQKALESYDALAKQHRCQLYRQNSEAIYEAYFNNTDPDSAKKSASGLFDEDDFNYYVRMYNEIKQAGGCVSIDEFNGSLGGDAASDGDWLKNMLSSGKFSIAIVNTDKKNGDISFSTTSTATDTTISETTTTSIDKKALAKAEAEYEHETKKIDQKDKKYDMELSKLETERNALKTEYDSVKKVVSDNIERTFGIFS